MKLFSVFAAGLLCITGCANFPPPAAEKTLTTSNKDYSLDQLFTDSRGNTVYRFFDSGYSRYYVVGPAGVQMLPSTEIDVQTDTVYVDAGGGDDSGGGGGHHGGGGGGGGHGGGGGGGGGGHGH